LLLQMDFGAINSALHSQSKCATKNSIESLKGGERWTIQFVSPQALRSILIISQRIYGKTLK
jgi:hypothetical protein